MIAATDDPGFDLEITRLTRRPAPAGGTWVSGTVAGHRFDALVFAEHAENPEYELGTSRISKLWVQRRADRATVFNFDRGLDVSAADPLAERIVGFLTEGLADLADAAGGARPGARVTAGRRPAAGPEFATAAEAVRYAVTIDGEIPFPVDDAEAVLEKISELFHLAEEALAVELERDRDQPTSAGDGPKSQAPTQTTSPNPTARYERSERSEPLPINRPPYTGTSRNGTGHGNSATPKQQKYVGNLARRKGLKPDALDAVIAQVVGSPKKVVDLTKREAGLVIDHLTNLPAEEPQ